jgi:NAD(P)-dependent dehydrogenase (short-subunit alcohol dehydrogenase family)
MTQTTHSPIRFDDRVAIVTGAGAGLGRSHAIELARRGAKLVINDLSADAAQAVVEDITRAGGEAFAHGANVTDEGQVADMVDQTMDRWGRVDILVNNAGILRDKSFTKMTLDEFRLVLDVHVMGAVVCTKAVWDHMKAAHYGRIVMTSSSSGIYGNFGQSNYGAAKMGLVGLMNVLHIEGEKYGIRVNALSPTAATQMTEGLISPQALELMTTQSVSAGLSYLVGDDAPSRLVLCAGAGAYAAAKVYETEGVYLRLDEQTAEGVAANIDAITDATGQHPYQQGFQQTVKFVGKAAEHFGVDLQGGL